MSLSVCPNYTAYDLNPQLIDNPQIYLKYFWNKCLFYRFTSNTKGNNSVEKDLKNFSLVKLAIFLTHKNIHKKWSLVRIILWEDKDMRAVEECGDY